MSNHDRFGRRSKAGGRARAILAAILASAPIAAGAADIAGAGAATVAERPRPVAAGGFTLGLDAAFGVQPARFGAADSTSTRAPDPGGQTVSIRDVRAFAVAMRQETPQPTPAEPAPRNGSFGRWLKRHWWVPALIGGAVLATAGESLYDDDDVDEDD